MSLIFPFGGIPLPALSPPTSVGFLPHYSQFPARCPPLLYFKVPATKSHYTVKILLRNFVFLEKFFPLCAYTQYLLRKHFLFPGDIKMFLSVFKNTLFPQEIFPWLRAGKTILGNSVSAVILFLHLRGLFQARTR